LKTGGSPWQKPPLQDLIRYLVRQLQPRRILLFGSRARGTARPGSDIDLAVEGALPASFREERKLKEKLDEMAGLYSVDLVFLDRTDGAFRRLVEQTGKVLYEKDRPATGA